MHISIVKDSKHGLDIYNVLIEGNKVAQFMSYALAATYVNRLLNNPPKI